MSEESEQDEGVNVRDAFVFKEGRTNSFYKVGSLAGSVAGESSAIICIAELGGRCIVAVPGNVWSKKVAKRRLEKTALGKAISIDLVASSLADLENPLPEVLIKAWVGVLSMHDEAKVEFSSQVPTYNFGEGILPYAEALVKVADDQFAFTTAESGGGGDGIFKRMAVVESGLADMREMLQTLVGQKAGAAGTPSMGARPKASSTGGRKAAAGTTPGGKELSGLDRGTVAAARAAGFFEESLREMSKLIGAKRARVEENPIPEALEEDEGGGILDDLAEEPEALEEIAEQDGNTLMQTAVVQLTKLVSNMALDKAKKSSDLETMLDQTGSSAASGDSAFGGARKSHATALRALTKAFNDSPRLIYESIEGQMVKDFGQTPAALSTGVCSARAWLCSRSRLGSSQNRVRWSWQVGGILDDLAAGETERARARAALLLAAADQASIDGGSWVVSTVSLLEPLPPYQEFSKHMLPGPSESQVSALYDPRWAEIFLRSLKERESYNEAKKKLQAAERGRGHAGAKAQKIHLEASRPKAKETEAKSRKVGRSKSRTSDARVGRGGWKSGPGFAFSHLLEFKSLDF